MQQITYNKLIGNDITIVHSVKMLRLCGILILNHKSLSKACTTCMILLNKFICLSTVSRLGQHTLKQLYRKCGIFGVTWEGKAE